jgi:integrase
VSDLQPIEPEAAIELYLEHRADEVSESTLGSHRRRLKHFRRWCDKEGFDNMNDVTGRDLHAFRVWRREDGCEDGEELAPASLQSQLSTLRMFLGFCASIDAVPEGLKSKVLLPSLSGKEEVSETTIDPELAKDVLDYLHRYQYASKKHVMFALLWRTGMRSGSLRALDVEDYDASAPALDVQHRPESDTPLKNGEDGERMVALTDPLAKMIEDYIDGPRDDQTDAYGREPLITTREGRPTVSTIRDNIYRLTRPCELPDRECPHDRDPETCEAMEPHLASKCPSTRSPHDLRSGAITAHLLDDVPVEIVSDRMNVSQKVLDRHYDRRDKRQKMEQRRKFLRGRE